MYEQAAGQSSYLCTHHRLLYTMHSYFYFYYIFCPMVTIDIYQHAATQSMYNELATIEIKFHSHSIKLLEQPH